jgi:hypothetical protein
MLVVFWPFMDSWRNEPELDKRNGDGDKEANRIVSKSEAEREGGGKAHKSVRRREDNINGSPNKQEKNK